MASSAKDESWPPRTVKEALMSSPSGRKRCADFEAGKATSPLKRPPGTPTLLDRLRLARNNQDHAIIQQQDDEEEEDEETLQLKLAAIEAKLKLKKLQNKAKREDGQQFLSRPASVASSTVPRPREDPDRIAVALSPVKRSQAVMEPKSPSRVLLGIDKGVKGGDVSLRRAKTTAGSPTQQHSHHLTDKEGRSDSRSSKFTPSRAREARTAASSQTKTFSERMAETRDNDKAQEEKRGNTLRSRLKTFGLDPVEMDGFRAAAEEIQSHSQSRSPIRAHAASSNSTGLCRTNQVDELCDLREPAKPQGADDDKKGDASLFEGFSNLHLSSRILPHSFLKRTLPSDCFTVYRIPDLLKNVTSPAYEMPDEVADFVVFGIIASRSNPLDTKNRADEHTKTSNQWEKKWDDGSQNRKKFMVFTLTDLKWTTDLYLFDTALPRYHRLTTGTVIAILNPSIMPPKKGREDTGAFSLALHNGEDTVLEIGTSQHLGYCNAVKRDGKECGQWVNASKSEICEWHLNAQIARTQSKRMGVNTGANGFGGTSKSGSGNQSNTFTRQFGGRGSNAGDGLRPARSGRGFDRESGSHFFFNPSNSGPRGSAPIYNPEISTAHMLDLDTSDPFIAEGQFSRDKEVRQRQRAAAQEKERDIARKLAGLAGGTSAGADYLRRKAEGDTSLKPRSELNRRGDGGSDAGTQDLKAVMMGRKRAAQDVRLSPVKKKTRFLTEKGIREAGRESLGGKAAVDSIARGADDEEDDDDDDLDII